MSFQPRFSLPRNTATAFPSTEDFFVDVLGRRQHDAHVQTKHQHDWLKRQNAGLEAGRIALDNAVAEMNAQARADREARR